MKRNIFYSIIAICIAFMTVNCSNELEYKEPQVTAVTQLLSPNKEQGAKLVASATASMFFEWAPAFCADGYEPVYEVLFDLPNGDFSKPLYVVPSDDNGARHHATITHKILDKVAQKAGIANAETGSVIWTVVASRGIKQVKSAEHGTLSITRLAGFAELPTQLFITGEGSEGGADMQKALRFTSTESGVYEIFTRLEAGKNYYFVDNKDGIIRKFYLSGKAIKEQTEGTPSATVTEGGVYRIILDFNIAASVLEKVESVGWYFSPSGKVDIPLSYQGNGIWQGSGATPFRQEGWGRDERYKFEMVVSKEGTRKTIHWGPVNSGLDSRPSDNEGSDYFLVKQWNPSQWDNKWKLHGIFDTEKTGNKTKFTLYLNGDAPYHHTTEIAQ